MKKKKLLLMIFLIISLLILSSYMNFRMMKVNNLYLNEFKDKLITTIQEDTSFHMKDLTPFDWDKAFIIYPYTSKTEMQKIVGKEWTTHNTYIGYLIEKTYFGEHPLDDDIFHKLVFVKDEEIILDITIQRIMADFTGIEGVIYFEDDFFIIDKMEDRYPIILRHK
ncbi:hypothetical protein [Natronincola ferrireducens]|uniref:DUF4830 domain-containing protein n=1 Tax=Natronincola ferrireducens TaxID=393762 RepID=A0A1G8ZCY8_9FIRM|nr:hypothetical protein [Natronincola ferrireducens]SDK12514.1 hypothetical protein SAMN05660472_00804 [Natronincola ferrireducens]